MTRGGLAADSLVAIVKSLRCEGVTVAHVAAAEGACDAWAVDESVLARHPAVAVAAASDAVAAEAPSVGSSGLKRSAEMEGRLMEAPQ